MNKFKVGDRVYYPLVSTKVLTAEKDTSDGERYTINVWGTTFTSEGKLYGLDGLDGLPALHHATPENHARLEKLYGVEFEASPLPSTTPTSREIVQALLDKGNKYVPCWVSDRDKNPTHINMWVCICFVKDIKHDGCFLDANDDTWTYATPFSLETGQPITELPE